jgi:hypothetical protein
MTDSAFQLFGSDLFGEQVCQRKNGVLAERFEFPPFSVLNAREGGWQERKRAWLSFGIQSELGRAADIFVAGEKAGWGTGGGKTREEFDALGGRRSATAVSAKLAPGGGGGGCWRGGPKTGSSERFGHTDSVAKGLTFGEMPNYDGSARSVSGTSIFDPVLCELAYKWFCPPGGQIVDPFAGGSVRGLVAGLQGYRYHGIDLRAEQIAANEAQRLTIAPDAPIKWVCGDSMDEMENAPPSDFVFSCPPYGDLERYSDDPSDLSTMEYHTFLAAYKRIILRCAQNLKDNRLACFVVGDFRDKKTGMYRGFVADTINAFREVGMPLYNDAVLVTAVGSLPIRVSSQFPVGRKLGKTHQNILVFAKGDPRKAFDKAT